MKIIRYLKKEFGTTIVLITHHMDEAAQADRVIVLDSGKIVMDGAPREVFAQVDKIRSLGLDVPAGTSIIYELERAGVDIPIENLTVEECADAIYNALA